MDPERIRAVINELKALAESANRFLPLAADFDMALMYARHAEKLALTKVGVSSDNPG